MAQTSIPQFSEEEQKLIRDAQQLSLDKGSFGAWVATCALRYCEALAGKDTQFSIEANDKDAKRIRQAATYAGHDSGKAWISDVVHANVEMMERARTTGRFVPSGTRIIPFEIAGEIDRAKQMHDNVDALAKDYVAGGRSDEELRTLVTRWLIELITEDRTRQNDATKLAKWCEDPVESEVMNFIAAMND